MANEQSTSEELIRQAAVLLERARVLNVQVTAEQLDKMQPNEINEARRAGRLSDLMKGI